jgi:hypothetical protein
VLSVPERWWNNAWEDQTFASCQTFLPVELGPGETISLAATVRVIGAFRLRIPLYVDSTRYSLAAETSPVFEVY